jgi:hypothetical protein
MTARGSAPAYENGAVVHATTIAHAKQSRTMTTLPASQLGFTAKARHGQVAPGQLTLARRAADLTRLMPAPETMSS